MIAEQKKLSQFKESPFHIEEDFDMNHEQEEDDVILGAFSCRRRERRRRGGPAFQHSPARTDQEPAQRKNPKNQYPFIQFTPNRDPGHSRRGRGQKVRD